MVLQKIINWKYFMFIHYKNIWHIPSYSLCHCHIYTMQLNYVAPGEAPHLLQRVVPGEGQGGQVLGQLPGGVRTGAAHHGVHGSH